MDSKYLVYFAPCGIGLGHAYRTLTVAKRLINLLSDVEVVFSTYGEAVDLIKKYGHRCLVERPVSYLLNEEGELDLRLTLARGPRNLYNFLRQIGDEIYFQTMLNPNLVLSDSRLSSLIAAKIRKCPSFLVINQLKIILPMKKRAKAKNVIERVMLNFFDTSWSHSEKIFIPDFPPPYTISHGNIPENGDLEVLDKVVFVGPLLPVWPNELPERKIIRERMNLDRERLILASFSGLEKERESLISYLLKSLSACKDVLKRENVKIIISGGDVPSHSFDKYFKNVKEIVEIRGWIENKHQLLKASDVAITHGGHTSVIEALIYGIPAIHVINPGHTERYSNALSAERLGVARALIANKTNVTDLCSLLIEVIYDKDMYRRVSTLSKKLTRYRGDMKIASILVKKLKEA